MDAMQLNTPVTELNGVGQTRSRLLSRLGIETLGDLLSFFPRTYEDRTKIVKLCDMQVDVPACFRATVISLPRTSRIRKGMTITKLTVSDMTARIRIVFFNKPYIADQLHYGEDYLFYGCLREGYGLQIQNPDVEPVRDDRTKTGRILPIYPLTAGLTNYQLCSYVQQAVRSCLAQLPEILPDSVRKQYDLCGIREAYAAIHAPKDHEQLARARRRLIFEEFFLFSAGLSILRSSREKQLVEPWETADLSAFRAALPYTLTGAQQRAIRDIAESLRTGVRMNRLVQGDVGSGKTAVAAAAAFLAHHAGFQTAFMAPTEILAEQHAKTLGALLGKLDIEVVLLTGALSAPERRWVLSRIEDGHAGLVVGTHALLTDRVTFKNLGLVITDEQHRFGVAQRAKLAGKSTAPHMLFLSATPIPRTLAMILYGDMAVSVLDELPPGRKKIDTFLVDESKRERAHAFIRAQVMAGHQVYVVCPAVEDNEDFPLKSAEVWSDHLQKEVFPDLRVGLIHGRLRSEEKDQVMQRSSQGELDILVATTVFEVGVDVPNATLMVIENAERFGMSQLHQLRGRVGRGESQSYCILFSDAKNEEARKRLKALCASNDGFYLAEQDLALRGPGDFFGSRQHGLPQFRVADLQLDMKTLREAQDASGVLQSEEVLHDPAYAPLLERIKQLFREKGDIFQ
ncbi:MAG: ATP-dependent DNA helicase RecG [Oscillospiraceae bacterium]|nr:ATP-dependent DNA helicase RecG [Oscillospiraceae bacterium]